MMKKVFRIITISLAVTLFCLTEGAGTAGEISVKLKSLSFEEYISTISKKLPGLKASEVALERARNQVSRAKAVDDTSITGDVAWSQVKQYSYGGTFEMDYSRGLSSSLGLRRTISATGTRLSTSFGYTWNDITGSSSLTTPTSRVSIPSYSPVFTFSVTQPLLKNFFGKIDRYGKKNARLHVQVETLKKEVNDRSVLNYYKKLYIRWIQYDESVNILQKSIDNSRRLEAQVRRKARRGLADNDDVQKMRTTVLSYETQYHQFKQLSESTRREIALFINTSGMEPDKAAMDRFFQKAGKNNYSRRSFEETANGRMLAVTLEQLSLNLGINKNDLLPSLDLYASVSQKANTGSFSSSFRDMKDTDYSVGLTISYPLGNHEKKGALRDTELALKDLQLSRESTVKEYHKNILQIQEAAEAIQKQIAVHGQSIAALNSQYRTEYQKYGQARLNLSFLVQTRNSIAAEEITLQDLKSQLIGLYFDYCDLVE